MKELESNGPQSKASLPVTELIKKIQNLEGELPDVPAYPRLIADDITPEKLGAVMAEQGEKIAIFSDEGGVLTTMGGRYNSGVANLDLLLKAHSGSPYRVDRASREMPISMKKPALTIALAVQPQVLREAA